jgi:sulfoxide reductase heme-binding subunit YedZ
MRQATATGAPSLGMRADAALARRGVTGALKAVIVVLGLFPVAWIAGALVFDPLLLGANPAETIVRTTGERTLQFLILSLSVTPLRRITRINGLIRFRRMLGLFAFFYAVLHLSSYVGFDRFFIAGEILEDIVKRPFITVGFLAFLLMTPLAVTSTKGWIRRLGAPAWTRLHRAAYAVAILGVVHHWWLARRDFVWPTIHLAAVVAVLGWRLLDARRRRLGRKEDGRAA